MPRADPAALAWNQAAEAATAAVQDHLDAYDTLRGHSIKLVCPQLNSAGKPCRRVIVVLTPEGSNGAVMPVPHDGRANMENVEWALFEDQRVGEASRVPSGGWSTCERPGCPELTRRRFCPAHASGKEYESSRLVASFGHRVRIWCPGKKCPYERTVTMARLSQLFVVAASVGSPQMWVE